MNTITEDKQKCDVKQQRTTQLITTVDFGAASLTSQQVAGCSVLELELWRIHFVELHSEVFSAGLSTEEQDQNQGSRPLSPLTGVMVEI